MANDSTVDQQQLQSTIDELYQTIKQLVRTSLSAIDVGDAQQLGELSLYTTLLEAAQAGQLGDRAAFIAMLNMVASDVGADPSGTAAQAMADHLAALNPHAQYAQKSSLGTAAAANTGTDAENVPTTAEADGRYARLSGANDLDAMPTVGGAPIVESGSNSDGEWTRWADGTQECRNVAYRVTYSGADFRIQGAWNYPKPFINQDYVVYLTYSAKNINIFAGCSQIPVEEAGPPFTGNYQTNLCNVNIVRLNGYGKSFVAGDFQDLDCLAVGYWK